MATTFQLAESPLEVSSERSAVANMARIYFATFWVIVFAGCIRKWIFPSTSILYLLQDLPIFIAYLYAVWSGVYSRSLIFAGVLCFSCLLVLQGLFQIIASGLSPFVAVVGMHNYFYYLPMVIVFPLALTVKFRRDFIRWNMWLSLPMCILALVQSQAPKSSFINRSTGGDAFGVTGSDAARVQGTFNFSAFYGIWVAMALALCLGEWLAPQHRRIIQNKWLLIACTFAVNLCYLVSSSRLAMANCLLVILGAVFTAGVLGAVRSAYTILAILLVIPIGGGLTYLIAPKNTEVMIDRITNQHYVDDGQNRIEEIAIGFIVTPKFDLIGAGIGMGVDAAHIGNVDTYNFTYELSEYDMTRNVMELGTLVGLIYCFTRLGAAGALFFLAYRMVRNGQMPHLLPMATFVLAQTCWGDMTRSAAMDASQVMVAACFVLGAMYNPEITTSLEDGTDQLMMRYA